MQQRQIGMSCVIAGVLWALAVLLTMAGSVFALGWTGRAWSDEVALVCYAHAMLVLTAAGVVTVQNVFRTQASRIIGAIHLDREMDQRLRKVP